MILFTAFRISEEAAEAAMHLQDVLRTRTPGSFPVRENLHVTVHYFGEQEASAVRGIASVLETCPLPDTEFCFDHLVRFSGARGDHLVYAAAENEALQAWRAQLSRCYAEAGFTFDEKPFLPHITLVRGKNGRIDTDGIEVPAVRFRPEPPVLLESLQIKGKRIYRPADAGKETQ